LIWRKRKRNRDQRCSRKEQKRSHTLRYVLKNRKTDTVYLVILFTLYLKEDVNEDGTIKEGVVGGKLHAGIAPGIEDHGDHEHQHENGHAANGHAEAGSAAQKFAVETSADDVD
jgi:hypothetical protein